MGGCLCAGFGCYPLLVYQDCSAHHMGPTFLKNYRELGQVTAGIIIQMLVDGAFFRGHAPRDIACDAVHELNDAIKKAYAAFFKNELESFRTAREQCQKSYNKCAGMAAEADPNLDLAPGPRTEFRHPLFLSALSTLKLVISDL